MYTNYTNYILHYTEYNKSYYLQGVTELCATIEDINYTTYVSAFTMRQVFTTRSWPDQEYFFLQFPSFNKDML